MKKQQANITIRQNKDQELQFKLRLVKREELNQFDKDLQDPEKQTGDYQVDKKKKKKRNKRNKKTQEDEVKTSFHAIYRKIYTKQQSFESLKDDIYIFIKDTESQTTFIKTLNQEIDNSIKIINENINCHLHKLIQPSQSRHNIISERFPDFSLSAIQRLRQQIQNVKQSSESVEKIINTYFTYYDKNKKLYRDQSEYLSSGIYNKIFCQLINSNNELKEFFLFCQNFINNNQIEQIQNYELFNKITQLLDDYNQIKSRPIKRQNLFQLFEFTTEQALRQIAMQDKTKKSKLDHKAHLQYKYDWANEQQQYYNYLKHRIESNLFASKRIQVQIDQNWVNSFTDLYKCS